MAARPRVAPAAGSPRRRWRQFRRGPPRDGRGLLDTAALPATAALGRLAIGVLHHLRPHPHTERWLAEARSLAEARPGARGPRRVRVARCPLEVSGWMAGMRPRTGARAGSRCAGPDRPPSDDGAADPGRKDDPMAPRSPPATPAAAGPALRPGRARRRAAPPRALRAALVPGFVARRGSRRSTPTIPPPPGRPPGSRGGLRAGVHGACSTGSGRTRPPAASRPSSGSTSPACRARSRCGRVRRAGRRRRPHRQQGRGRHRPTPPRRDLGPVRGPPARAPPRGRPRRLRGRGRAGGRHAVRVPPGGELPARLRALRGGAAVVVDAVRPAEAGRAPGLTKRVRGRGTRLPKAVFSGPVAGAQARGTVSNPPGTAGSRRPSQRASRGRTSRRGARPPSITPGAAASARAAVPNSPPVPRRTARRQIPGPCSPARQPTVRAAPPAARPHLPSTGRGAPVARALPGARASRGRPHRSP